MKKTRLYAFGFCSLIALMLIGCSESSQTTTEKNYKIGKISAEHITIDAKYDANPNPELEKALQPYQEAYQEQMLNKIGVAEEDVDKYELCWLASHILRTGAAEYNNGKVADFAIMNNGGVRTTIHKGEVTNGDIFSIFPFENSLALVELTGKQVKELLSEVAFFRMGATDNVFIKAKKSSYVNEKDGKTYTCYKYVSATIGGKEIDDDKKYMLATIDYLAEGNSGLKLLAKVEGSFTKLRLRDMVINYIKEGNAISYQTDNKSGFYYTK